MGAIASQITSLTIVYSTVYSDADQRKHQSSASLAFVWGIHRGPVNSPHKWPVTRRMFPFDDAIVSMHRISANRSSHSPVVLRYSVYSQTQQNNCAGTGRPCDCSPKNMAMHDVIPHLMIQDTQQHKSQQRHLHISFVRYTDNVWKRLMVESLSLHFLWVGICHDSNNFVPIE